MQWCKLTMILQSVSGYLGLTDSTANTVEINLRTLRFVLLLAKSLLWNENFSRQLSKWNNPTKTTTLIDPYPGTMKESTGTKWFNTKKQRPSHKVNLLKENLGPFPQA